MGGTGVYYRSQSFQAQQNVFKKLERDREFISQALNTRVDTARELLPKGMRVDAKTTTVQWLWENLSSAESDFSRIGKSKVNAAEGNQVMIES
jgi:hypothetical protein